ncbi:MAG: hypothetical protein AB1716_02000 [Planctomycetota bacterium]
MSTLTKVFIVLASVMAIVLSSLTVAVAARWTKQRETLDAYQQLCEHEFAKRLSLETAMYTQLAMKDDQLRRSAQSVATLEREKRELSEQQDSLRTELARATEQQAAAEAGRKKLEEMLGVQTAQLTGAQKRNEELTTQNIDLQKRNLAQASRILELSTDVNVRTDENRSLQEKLYAMEQRNKELEQAGGARRVTRAAEPPAGVQPVSAAVAPPIEGEVTTVDGNYISISIGESSGVTSGMQFMIYRGGTYVGDMQVENVRPKEAGGKLLLVKAGQQVQSGDRVSYGMVR